MNLVLISMQEHGYIKISLNCEEMSTKESDTSMAMVELTVEDSGKGISQAYMDTKMFTSFAQEDSLCPGLNFLQRDFFFFLIVLGTGLGLSLVQSLVQMMDGDIEVQSKVNHGTKVRVRIPMKRAGPTRDLRDGFHRPNEDDIHALRTIQPRPQIVNFQQDILPEDTSQKQEGYQMQKHALAACINGWYKVEALHHWDIDTDNKPDIILVDDVHLLAITKHLNLLKEIDAVVVILCSDRSRTTVISKNVDYPKLHIMPKPFGPFKLAKALKHALDKRGPVRGTTPGPTIAEEIGPIPELKQLSPTLRRSPSHSGGLSKLIKKPSFNGSFPFPSMTVTPDSTSPVPRIPVTTPQIEVSGTHHRRLKILDVPSSKQKPLEEHNRFIRSHSEGGQTESSQYKTFKPRILLVDDNEVNLKLLQTFFVRRGFTDMRLARDGSEAVKVYEDALHEHDPFHLVFMDISMPVSFGISTSLTLSESNLAIRS
jgi:CheY-like chemotaxis protein